MNNTCSEHWTSNFTTAMQLANLIPGKSIQVHLNEVKSFQVIDSKLRRYCVKQLLVIVNC